MCCLLLHPTVHTLWIGFLAIEHYSFSVVKNDQAQGDKRTRLDNERESFAAIMLDKLLVPRQSHLA